jgi:hypothetical protein
MTIRWNVKTMIWYLKLFIPLAILTLFMTSCAYFEDFVSSSTVADDTPPSWIELRDAHVTTSELLRVLVNEAEIWEPGDDDISFRLLYSQRLHIKIDGHVLTNDKVFVLDTFENPTYVYDGDGNILGSHGGWTDVVFAPSASAGSHTATIQITSTSGRLFAYSWEFVVPQPTDTP